MSIPFITLDGLRVDAGSVEQILSIFRQKIQAKTRIVFAYVNAHAFNLALDLPWFRQYINKADVVLADGQGIRFASWLRGERIPPHLPITGWIWDLLRICQDDHFSVFFLGGGERVAEDAARRVHSVLPALKVVGTHHGYFKKEGKETQNVVRAINDVSPDVLLVGFGMPMQERWIEDNVSRLDVRAILPVGGCLDVLAGKRVEVPHIMRRVGLEWLWRLVQEPRRLFVRYVVGNPKFVWNIMCGSSRKGKLGERS